MGIPVRFGIHPVSVRVDRLHHVVGGHEDMIVDIALDLLALREEAS